MPMRVSVKRLLKIATGIAAIACTNAICAAPTVAAQKVVVRYGSLSQSIDVKELRTIAETGTIPKSLSSYAKRLSAQQRQLAVGAMRTSVPLNVVALSKLLNTRMGTAILSDLATIAPREDYAGAIALRAAMVLGARAPKGLSILSFIEAYPSERLTIDLKQAFEVMGNLNASFWQTQRFISAIAPQLAPQNFSMNLPFDPAQAGSAAVQVRQITLTDSQRERSIPVDIYWSNSVTAAKPIVVFSHGMGSTRTDMRYLARHLASHGYIAVAPEHPGSNAAHVKGALAGGSLIKPEEFLERPRDMSFVLDELEKLNKTASPLQGKLDTNNVMVVGHSMGGGTVLSIAGGELQLEGLKQRCQDNLVPMSLGEGLQCVASGLPENRYQTGDRRIKRAIAINPISSLIFGETGLSKIQVPTLLVAGSADKITPAITEQILAFTKIPASKWLVGMLGATHLSIQDPSTAVDRDENANTPIAGGEIYGEQSADIRKYMQAITLAMAAQMTSDADRYAIFLTPEYAQSASTEAFPIRLVKQLPVETERAVKTFIHSQSPSR